LLLIVVEELSITKPTPLTHHFTLTKENLPLRVAYIIPKEAQKWRQTARESAPTWQSFVGTTNDSGVGGQIDNKATEAQRIWYQKIVTTINIDAVTSKPELRLSFRCIKILVN
jgi:hypothetical protein